jgi:pSer/pThr/pTyr-binding forkhead associated (FHA) protein
MNHLVLVPLNSGAREARILAEFPADMGRSPGCTISIDHPAVSGRHATIFHACGAFFIMDRHSTNGVFIEGRKIFPGRLEKFGSGMTLSLGGTAFLARIEDNPEPGGTRTVFSGLIKKHGGESARESGGALVRLDGAGAGDIHILPLSSDRMTAGRAAGADIPCDDPGISFKQFEILRTPRGWAINDCGSRNGTFLGKSRLRGTRVLENGDIIAAGEMEWMFICEDTPPARSDSSLPASWKDAFWLPAVACALAFTASIAILLTL